MEVIKAWNGVKRSQNCLFYLFANTIKVSILELLCADMHRMSFVKQRRVPLVLWNLIAGEVWGCCCYGSSNLLGKCEVVVVMDEETFWEKCEIVVIMDEMTFWRSVRLLLLWKVWLVGDVCYRSCYYYGKSGLLEKCEIVVVVIMEKVTWWRSVRLLLLWKLWLVGEVWDCCCCYGWSELLETYVIVVAEEVRITLRTVTTLHWWHSVEHMGPNGSCLFTARSPTDAVDGQIFWAFSTHQIAFGGGVDVAGTVAPISASVCRQYQDEPWTGLDTNAH